jgi:hypothetical protein
MKKKMNFVQIFLILNVCCNFETVKSSFRLNGVPKDCVENIFINTVGYFNEKNMTSNCPNILLQGKNLLSVIFKSLLTCFSSVFKTDPFLICLDFWLQHKPQLTKFKKIFFTFFIQSKLASL